MFQAIAIGKRDKKQFVSVPCCSLRCGFPRHCTISHPPFAPSPSKPIETRPSPQFLLKFLLLAKVVHLAGQTGKASPISRFPGSIRWQTTKGRLRVVGRRWMEHYAPRSSYCLSNEHAKALRAEYWRQELQIKCPKKYSAIEWTQSPNRQETQRTSRCGFG